MFEIESVRDLRDSAKQTLRERLGAQPAPVLDARDRVEVLRGTLDQPEKQQRSAAYEDQVVVLVAFM